MRTQGIYLNVSRRNDDLPEMIEEYSEKFNLYTQETSILLNAAKYPSMSVKPIDIPDTFLYY